jgi:methyl-accepting chemotaxis protein
VVADEVRDLAKTVNTLPATIHAQIDSISAGLVKTYDLIKEVARIDTSEENYKANSRIESVMQHLVEQNLRFAAVLKQTAATSESITQEVSSAVVRMQFQDRAKQRLENVSAGLGFQVVGRIANQDCGRRPRDCQRAPRNQEYDQDACRDDSQCRCV